jgi:hypothetical protein
LSKLWPQHAGVKRVEDASARPDTQKRVSDSHVRRDIRMEDRHVAYPADGHLACRYLSTRRHAGSMSAEVRAGLANGWEPNFRWSETGNNATLLLHGWETEN